MNQPDRGYFQLQQAVEVAEVFANTNVENSEGYKQVIYTEIKQFACNIYKYLLPI